MFVYPTKDFYQYINDYWKYLNHQLPQFDTTINKFNGRIYKMDISF